MAKKSAVPSHENSGATTKPKGRGRPWRKGQSGNPKGRPKSGSSWAEVIREISALSPKEAAELCMTLGAQFAELGDKVTLKEAVVLRTFLALLSEPNAGLLNSMMNRSEGNLPQGVVIDDWRSKMVKDGINPDAAQEEYIKMLDRLAEENVAAGTS